VLAIITIDIYVCLILSFFLVYNTNSHEQAAIRKET